MIGKLRFVGFLALLPLVMAVTEDLNLAQRKVLHAAEQIFKRFQVSYVYGGGRLGDVSECESCNKCLEAKVPLPDQRLSTCPVCQHCSLDCSHFTKLVFESSGLFAPYLTSKQMATLAPAKLLHSYAFLDLGTDLNRAQPGDLLVYHGHVVMLTERRADGKGDIVHATGGRELKGPGQGIQKERLVWLDGFRGPLLRILRHKDLSVGAGRVKTSRLRPVPKRPVK